MTTPTTFFPTRWCLTGTLTTRTSLHIGAGTTTDHPDLKNDKDDKPVKIAAIVRDYQDQPYIPASTLKGNLRAWLKDRVTNTTRLNAVFGKEVDQEDPGQGGKVEFGNAFFAKAEDLDSTPTYWCEKRLTGIEVGVTIDRLTRTAQKQRLFHHEFVPPGVSFKVHITGKDLNDCEIALLLAGLEGFNHTDQPIRLGGDNAQNKGCFTWQLETVAQLDQEATKKWLAQDSPGMWYTALRPVTEEKKSALERLQAEQLLDMTRPLFELHLQLKFDSPFLVNDPYWKNLATIEDVEKQTGVKCPDHQPRRDHLGKAVLPSQSLRGAIRAQAERIIRTLGGKACELTCDPIDKREEVEKLLCLACQLFGATSWQSPIHISNFTLQGEAPSLHQEFVAIDRFTGGGGEHLKFNAAPVYQPTFAGIWKIDLRRVEPWGLGLLALLIRDMIEGDVTFGYGAAKGYGHCRAEVVNWSVTRLEKVAELWGLPLEELQKAQQEEKVRRALVNKWVREFQQQCKVTQIN